MGLVDTTNFVSERRAPASSGPAKNSDSRLRYIDALRGIAALLVVWLHVVQSYVNLDPKSEMGGRYLYTIAQNFDVGRIGVILFFLVSGYVIPFSIPRDRASPIGQFLIKRFFRIYPAYWLSVPLGAAVVYWLWGQPFSIRELLVNLTLLQDVFGVRAAQGVYWTLLVELGFYALCSILFLANSLYNPMHIGVLAMVLGFVHSLSALLIWLGIPLIGLTPTFWCLHLSLMLCGTLYRHCTLQRSGVRSRAHLVLLGLLIYYLVVFPAGAIWANGFFRNYVVSDAFGVLLFILGTTVIRIETRATDQLGAISYSIYLFHLVAYYPIFRWLTLQPASSPWRSQHLGLYLLGNIMLTIMLASVVYRFVEQPSIRFGHRCAQRWARRRLPAQVPTFLATPVVRRDE